MSQTESYPDPSIREIARKGDRNLGLEFFFEDLQFQMFEEFEETKRTSKVKVFEFFEVSKFGNIEAS